MKCPRCQQNNPPKAKFCLECGTPLAPGSADPKPSYADVELSLADARARESATSEILHAISGSSTDVQAVFNTIVQSGLRLLGGYSATMMLLRDDDRLDLVAYTSTSIEADSSLVDAFPMPLHRLPPGERAIRERRAQAVEDVGSAPDVTDVMRETGRARGWRSNLFVPMVRDDVALGLISITRREAGPFAADQIAVLEIFAAEAVIAIENVRLFTETKEALERQTATSEILEAISGAQTDINPVFDAIARSAVRLCGAFACRVFRAEDELLAVVGEAYGTPDARALFHGTHSEAVGRDSPSGTAIRERRVVQYADVPNDPDVPERYRERARARGYRALMAVPMVRDEVVLGTITVARQEAVPFSERQVALVKTFADQAVIAIENVRLFNETKEALDRQTATSEILRVIASSPTDVQPVFDAIARHAVALCGGTGAVVLRFQDEMLEVAAHHNVSPDGLALVEQAYPRPPAQDFPPGRAFLERTVIHVPDLQAAREFSGSTARQRGAGSQLAVPLLREQEAIGVIGLARDIVGPFPPQHIEVLQTFADQAVIALENVRLFTELQARNHDLHEALEQQTATSEILRVISTSPSDVQPVFDSIVRNAVRLCEALHGGVYRFDGKLLHAVANAGYTDEQLEHWRRQFPRPVSADDLSGRTVLTRGVVRIADHESETALRFSPEIRANLRARGTRSLLSVPMLRQNEVLGVISLGHGQVDAFSDSHVALLQTFADQAVIAIENVRLFKELEARTAALTRSVAQLTALGEVGRAVSSTLDLETVLTTIVSRAVQLSGLDGGVVLEYDEGAQEFVHRAQAETGGALAAARRATRIRKGEGVVGQTAITLEPVQVPDITGPEAYVGPNRENLIESGIRAIVAVPMVCEDRLIGCLGVTRSRPGAFPAETIELLRTFATQSALAIQNARLFHEIEDKSRQLEAASRHKSEFLANMSHELRTPLNAIIGFSEVLTERMFGELNEKQDEYLKDIYASGQHLLSLINDILDLSKIEAGRMELEAADFDLSGAIDNALTFVRERAGRRGIMLGRAIDQRVGTIHADERKVKQVLLNLLSNALKFTPEGGRIDVRAAVSDGMAEVSVADTGVGIAPEDQAAVFEEFRQVGTADKKVEGTGLGLALSRKFIELHGGRIWVRSQVGEGSTFTFKIPMQPGA